MLEPLEARIAPAAVTVSYTDIDGDLVKITDSTGHLSLWYLNPVAGSMGNNFQLGTLNLADPIFSGANITFAVTKATGGDGLAHVGYINATGVDLGDVKLVGDLGAIDAGSGGAVPAVKSLTVRSIGLFGTATGAPDLISNIKGALGALTVTTDVKDAIISVADSMKTTATIGALKIGGSLLGGLTTSSGVIQGYGGIASVTIGGNLVGGAGIGSGAIVVNDGAMGAVTLGGSLLGGAGTNSGQIDSLTGGIGAIKIGGNVHGDIGAQSGKIDARTSIASLTVGGSVIGGSGAETYSDGTITHDGQVFAGGTIGNITIAHDVHGGAGDNSARIHSVETMGDVTIGGSVIGVGTNSGVIEGGFGMGVIKVGHDVQGGAARSGSVASDGPVVSVAVGGSVIGGAGDFSGVVAGGTVTIGHDLIGGAGHYSGRAFGGNNFSVTIGGSVVGGTGQTSGGIFAGNNLVSVKIGRDLIGASLGSGQASIVDSGYIFALQHIGSIEIGGSIISGTDSSSSGSLFGNATIRAGDDIGSITVKGDIAGNQLGSDISSVIISARGQATPGDTADVAIGKITVGHRVEQLKVLAGYQGVSGSGSAGPTASNADAQIGTVTVGGDWIASDLVAGVKNVSLQSFGDANDAKISGGTDDPGRTSKIGSITIAGRALGAPTSSGTFTDNRHFGFVAEEIGSLKILGKAFTLDPALAEGREIGRLTGLSYHEVSAAVATSIQEGPITLVPGGKVVTYIDLDGDTVTVTLSKALLTDANFPNVFKFDSPYATVVGQTTFAEQLEMIDLNGLAADGLNITVTVKRGAIGDGLADIGYIRASNLNLGAVSIPGDLGQIDVGASVNVALKSLKVRSLGRLGITSQPPAAGSFLPDLFSSIQGPLGSLTITADVKDASVAGFGMAFYSDIGSVTIGGSLLGGKISSGTKIGAVKIGGSIAGGSAGGGIRAGSVASVTVGGSFVGGGVSGSGQIFTDAHLGAITIAGNVVGGAGQNSALVNAGTSLGNVKIGGSLLGSGSASTAQIDGSSAGTIAIGHNAFGGAGPKSGSISFSSAKGVTVGGSLIGGGGGDQSGSILADAITGAVKIGHNMLGGAANISGAISATKLATLTIGGSVVGSGGGYSASITSSNGIGALKIGHDVTGGGGANSALITSAGDTIKSVTIGGSLLGGTAGATGGIFATGSIGAVKIGRDVQGGSVTGSAAGFTNSGSILAGSRLGAVTLGGSLIAGLDNSTGGSLTTSGSIRAGDDLAGLTATGSLLGRATANGSTLAIVSAGTLQTATQTSDLVIGKVSVGGLVNLANILAGYTTSLVANDPNAQIGAVTVKGNWLASNLLAGAENLGANDAPGGGDDNLNFGDSHDRIIGGAAASIARIASITIGGSVAGTAGGTDHFGFVTHTIGSFKSAGFTALLHAATPGELIPLSPSTGDVAVQELPQS